MNKINLTKYTAEVDTQIKKGVNQSLEVLKDFAEVISPTDTETFIKAHKIEKATDSGKIIEGTLYNDTEYAEQLEYGVNGNKYNYHKGKVGGPRKVIYSGVGNRTYTRTRDINEQEVVKIIKDNIKID